MMRALFTSAEPLMRRIMMFPFFLFSLTGCGVVVATVDTAASVAGSAISIAGDVAAGTVHVMTAPLRGGDERPDTAE